MADVKRTVQVDINVTGTNKNVLADLGKAFDSIAKSAKDASIAIGNRGFNKSLQNIKPPENLTKVANELERISKIKLPNVKQLAEGFAGLAKIKEPPNLTRFAEEAKKLNNIKVPNIKQLAQGLDMLTSSSLSMTDVGARLRIVHRNLKRFSEINVPNITKIAKGLEELNRVAAVNVSTKSLESLGTFLKSLNGLKIPSLTKLSEGIRTLGDSTLKLGDAYKNLNQIYFALKQFTTVKVPNLNALVTGIQKFAALEVTPLTEKIKKLNAALSELDKKGHLSSFSKFAGDLNQITGTLKRTNQEFQNFNQTAQKAAGNMRSWGDRIKNYFQYRVVADALFLIRNAITSSWQAIKDYDQALKDLQAITGATGLEVEQMGETIKQVASTTKFSASEVAEGMRIIGQAGFSAAEAIQTMQAVSDLATGTLSSMASTVDLVTTAMRVFKIDASESASVADVFANAVNRSKLTIDKLRTSFNYVGPIARDVGVSFKESAAAMMTLANSGLRASTIGTGLRRVLAELADPSEKLRAAVRNAGLALGDIDPQTRGFREVIANLGIVISDTGIAFDLFGKRGAAAALALTDSKGQFNTMLDTVNRSGIAAQQAAKQMEGLGVSFKNLTDKLGLLAIQIGDAGITQALKFLIDVARNVVDAITAIADTALARFIIKVGLAAASLTVIIGLFKGLIALQIPSVFISIAGAVTKLASAFAFAEVSMSALLLVFGNVAAILTVIAIAAASMFGALGDAREAAEDAAKLADEYSNLSKKFTDYKQNVIGLEEDSDELKEINLALRDSLLKVADGNSEVADEAEALADAIDPLNGKIEEGTEALENYATALEDINFEKLLESANKAAENALSEAGRGNRILSYWDDVFSALGIRATAAFKAMGTAANFEFSKIPEVFRQGAAQLDKFGEQSAASLSFAKALRAGKKNFKDFDDYVKSLRGVPIITSQTQDLIDAFKFLDERVTKTFDELVKYEKIDLNDTEENIKKLVESYGFVGLELEGIIQKVREFQEASSKTPDNIIEQWAQDLQDEQNGIKKSVIETTEDFKKMGGIISEEQEKQIRNSEKEKAAFVERRNEAEKTLKDEIQAGKDKTAAYTRYHETIAQLDKEARETTKRDSENEALQRIRAYEDAAEAHRIESEKIRANDALTIDTMTEKLVKSRVEFEKTSSDLLNAIVDPKKLVSDIKEQEKEVKARYSTMYKEIELAVLEGRIQSREYANSRLKELEIREAEAYVKLWKETYDKVYEASGPDSAEAKAANKKRLEAQIALNNLIVEQEKEVLEEQAKIREDAYKRMEASREVAYKAYEAKINQLVAEGVITYEDGEVRKLSASIRFYEQALMAARSFRQGIDQLQQPDEYQDALEAELKAEEALYAARSKALEDYTKQAKTLSDEIIKDKRKLQREEQSHEDKLQDIKKTNKEKLVDIEDDYTDAVRDLNYDLQDKLADLEQKRLDTVKKFADKRKELEEDYVASVNESNDSIDDLIQKLRQSDLEDANLERSKEAYAVSELAELESRLREARKEGNAEEIKSIIDRSDKIKDLYADMADTGRAIRGLEDLKRFREEAITVGKDLALEKIDEEEKLELEKQQKELDHVNELHTRKITDLEEEHTESLAKQEITFNDAIDKETKRHALAMENIQIEANEKLKKAIEINNAINAIEAQNQGSIAPTTSTAPPAGTPKQQTPTQPQTTGANSYTDPLSAPLLTSTDDVVQKIQTGGTLITQVLTDAIDLSKAAGKEINTNLSAGFTNITGDGVEKAKINLEGLTDAVGMTEKGTIDLKNRLEQIGKGQFLSVNVDGVETLIPTVDELGNKLSQFEAIDLFKETGKHLGKFDSLPASLEYAKKLRAEVNRISEDAKDPIEKTIKIKTPREDFDRFIKYAENLNVEPKIQIDTEIEKAKQKLQELNRLKGEGGFDKTEGLQLDLQISTAEDKLKHLIILKEDLAKTQNVEIGVTPKIDKAEVEKEAKEATSGKKTEVPVKPVFDHSDYIAEQKKLESKEKPEVEVKAVIGFDENSKPIYEGDPVDVPAKIDVESISADIDTINEKLKSLKDFEISIQINSDEVDALIKKLDSIDGRTTRSTHIIKQITTGAAATGGLVSDLVQRFSSGGMVFKRLADRLITAGSGFKDDVPILVKKKEFVHRPEAVDYYGVPFMRALNSLRIPKFGIPGFSEGGLVGAASFDSTNITTPQVNVTFSDIVPGAPSVQAVMDQINVDELMNQLAMRAKYRS